MCLLRTSTLSWPLLVSKSDRCNSDKIDDIWVSVLILGINVPAYFPALFATYIEKAGGVDKFFSGPAVGGGT